MAVGSKKPLHKEQEQRTACSEHLQPTRSERARREEAKVMRSRPEARGGAAAALLSLPGETVNELHLFL